MEDSADTLGATINSKPSGIYSDISITSFYGSHIISCAGNGGMFLTNNKKFFVNDGIIKSRMEIKVVKLPLTTKIMASGVVVVALIP